ncbi:YjaG family protein [Catenovulum sp. 2E275]|uniref:YjaG family protein n=1 Tax=Catenovulum sp. 2E275 TaxID=2980497 RepID=UPI0021D12CA5|nr:YjaG family protein [Catenovulum sp. 2E275]MCU4675862.1 YjaG family protein [Catenovulum sp. 2E275]
MKKPATFARIRALKPKQQIAFNQMLICRMLPNYALYQELTQTGDIKVLENISDLIWQWLYTPKFNLDQDLQQEKIEAVIPTAQPDDGIGVYAAIDVSMALIANISILKDSDYRHKEITLPSLISQGTIERLLITTAEVEHSQEALAHPHMQWEIETQNEFLDAVEKIKTFTKAECRELKKIALADGMTNLGLEIETEN